jgi:hypothetical protein
MNWRVAIGGILLLACCLLIAHSSYGQTGQSQPNRGIYDPNRSNVANAIARVKSGNFVGVDVDMIRREAAVEAIPALREQFARVKDPLDRAQIASVLMKLGDKDEIYWDFLVKLATQVIDAPDFGATTHRGNWFPAPPRSFSPGRRPISCLLLNWANGRSTRFRDQ